MTVTMPAGGQVGAGPSNVYHLAPGIVWVDKTITGPAAGEQGDIELLVSCPALGKAASWVIPAGAQAGSQHRYRGGIPGGTTCTVTETATGASRTVEVTAQGSGESATVRPRGIARLTVTNTVTSVKSDDGEHRTVTPGGNGPAGNGGQGGPGTAGALPNTGAAEGLWATAVLGAALTRPVHCWWPGAARRRFGVANGRPW
ncbi:hypothetical protein FOE78_03850 [Microlunatus elymi]|uniref:DUF5979 domain-containing protein n=1 Tax=Microlunatus elymi TaxID=2596828 RepID=A0A516PVL2_9ACTN|nr:DUF5979 domain-containing protein [Microlunatus elymi]QDP95162.1 hypothetical protein FOE78_03850 [Microlunatus elymi]